MKNIFIPIALVIVGLTTAFVGNPKSAIKLTKSFSKEFSSVPDGGITVDNKEYQVGTFFISKTEVSNSQYRAFLAAMDTADAKIKEVIAIHHDNWIKGRWKNEAFVEYYSSHPAYQEYPVVNISHEAAQLYCEWLTALYKSQYISLPGNVEVTFRLPTHMEWMHAARGRLQGPYAWGGPYLRNKQGSELARYMTYGAETITYDQENETYKVIPLSNFMGVAGAINDNADVTAPVRSYAPNGYEIYNMNGNVAEMLAEPGAAAGGSWASPGYDIRNESIMNYEVTSPCVGFRPIAVVTQL